MFLLKQFINNWRLLKENATLLSRKYFLEGFQFLIYIQYNINAISKYMSFLYVDRSSFNRDYSTFILLKANGTMVTSSYE